MTQTTRVSKVHIRITRLEDGSFAYLGSQEEIEGTGSAEEVQNCRKKCGHEIMRTLMDHFEAVENAGESLTDDAAKLAAKTHSFSGLKTNLAQYCATLTLQDVTAEIRTPYIPEA
jgi:Uri superfamily endonuclease